ncbi:glucosaminidase domain-containing protein [Pseudidiomarina andamanensis]|uniref:Peptidoglycan hydrolase n=1 Tax=Pseudidiomarina andamanensis TaxID=1940690 RepID=A0AA92ERB2_9GAMM|nr:glucosaminidase domain-containing protein [Pseudidiomarina andamanensis]MDS0218298.1 glucosaminidase domain-containing protein [Pseudidiomarina andamanensis]QGT95183.1 peptidoglycan hydrolase [Pseudidiomarina andamanensis]
MRFLGWAVAVVLVVLAIWLPTQLHVQPESIHESEATTELPQVGTVVDVPDFNQFADVRDKKQAFFSFLAPIVQVENSTIEQEREQIVRIQEHLLAGNKLSNAQTKAFATIAKRYNVEIDTNDYEATFAVLLRRVDVVPEALVLVQAANESGWGTSRFATEALNFFGQWCFRKGCGLVPDARVDGMNHEVRKFSSVNASVRSYLRNINTHPAYFELRQLRAEKRASGADVRALDLTPGLLSYSERGEEYIHELNSMIRVNRPIIFDVLEPNPNPNLNSAPE